jgi:methionine-gamma-lyase
MNFDMCDKTHLRGWSRSTMRAATLEMRRAGEQEGWSTLNTRECGTDTKLVHAGNHPDETGAVTVPIYQTSTFAFRSARHGAALFAGEEDGYIYTRIGNPTVRALEENIAELEHGFGGIATSSGMGAVCAVYMALLESGAHIVSTASVYGPSRGLIEKDFSRFGVDSAYVDSSDLDKLRAALRPNTRLVYIESPSNPAMQVTDIKAAAAIAHEHGCVVVVDNTFASPYLQNPLDLGADVVLHSVTKFINGHADVVGGIIVAREPDLYKRLRKTMVNIGCNMDPHQAFLVLRGVKTLGLRVERAQKNAMQIARWLVEQPEIESVRYIGLESHPQHELAKRQMKGFGSMIAFELKGGFEAGRQLMDSVKVATLAVSLGGVETLIEHPASMTHAGVSQRDRIASGFSDGLVRYSVGIENVEDLISDLRQALDRIEGSKSSSMAMAEVES